MWYPSCRGPQWTTNGWVLAQTTPHILWMSLWFLHHHTQPLHLPPRDGSGDHTVPPHPDLTQSWRESWEAQDFKFSRPLEFVPILHALSKLLKFSPPPADFPPGEESEYSIRYGECTIGRSTSPLVPRSGSQ